MKIIIGIAKKSMKSTSAERLVKALVGKWYIVDQTKRKDTIAAGPFPSKSKAEDEKESRGWSDKGPVISHTVLSGRECRDEGIYVTAAAKK